MLQDLTFFERLAADIGAAPALQLCAFYGGRTCYAPEEFRPAHPLCKLLGEEAFLKMIAAYGGETFSPPSLELKPLRTAGTLAMLAAHKLPTRTVARLLGMSHRRVNDLVNQFRRDGIPELINLVEDAAKDFETSMEETS